MQLGIDVSYHNGKIDWQAVKNAGVKFVIARCGYGPKTKWSCTLDETFFDNVEQAHNAGLKVGAYFYSYALNPEEARQEGEWTRSILLDNNVILDILTVIDIEDADSFKSDNNFDFSRQNCTAICQAFLDAMKPLDCGVYTALSWLEEYVDWQKLGCAIWSAQWVSSDKANNLSLEQLHQYNALPTYMWQFTDEFYINGKVFDANILYV